MIEGVPVGEVRPGYELWRPNREKAESITTKFVIVFLMLVTGVIAGIITIAGFNLLVGGGAMGLVCIIYTLLYFFFAFLVFRWSRGILPVAAALSIILAIFCLVGAGTWFERDKPGFSSASLPVSVIGLLVVLLAIVQLISIVAFLFGFNQEWQVEEERQIGSSEDYGAGAPPEPGSPQPA
jgi:hypothetical protein